LPRAFYMETLLKKLIAPLLIGLVGGAILIALGIWQIQRLHWKEALLAQIESRIHAAPVAIPEDPKASRDEFLAVRMSGTIESPDLQVLASVKGIGAGYRIITAFETDDGRRVLLDRGFVALPAKDAPRPAVHATITGNLRWPDEKNGSTPPRDEKRNIWFARDLQAMAKILDTEPVLVVQRFSDETSPVTTPYPVDTKGIPNNHLQYVVTWFGLAIVWLGMTAYWLWRIRRKTD